MLAPRSFTAPSRDTALPSVGAPLHAKEEDACILDRMEPRILSHMILSRLPLASLHAFTACSKTCHTFVERELHTRVRVIGWKGYPVEYIVQSTRVMREGRRAMLHLVWYHHQAHCFIHRLSMYFERTFGTLLYSRDQCSSAIRWQEACRIVHKFADDSKEVRRYESQWPILKEQLDGVLHRRATLIDANERTISESLRKLAIRAAKAMDRPTHSLVSTEAAFKSIRSVKRAILGDDLVLPKTYGRISVSRLPPL